MPPKHRRRSSTTRAASRQLSDAEGSSVALLAMNRDINTGSQILRPEDMLFRNRPGDPCAAFKRARQWQIENWFVGMVNKGNVDFFNHGLKILPEDNTKKNRKALADWFKANPKPKQDVLRYILTVMREYVLNQNVVSFWREGDVFDEVKKTCPFVILGEQCEYRDAMGLQLLRWTPDYDVKDFVKDADERFNFSNPPPKPERLDDRNRNRKMTFKQRYFEGRKILLSEEYDEHFEVLTTAYKGRGFSMPDLYSVFRTLTQNEHMEVGEEMLGLLSRRVTLQHKLGFELKGQNGGPNAAFQKDLSIWKKKRADAIISFFNGRFGFVETTTNFDHEMKLNYVDPKLFEEKRWGSVLTRLVWYGGPLAMMMLAKAPNPFLLPIFKTLAEGVRSEVGGHLNYTINQGATIPMRVALSWSNRCFYDPRLAWDMVNGLMKQGPLSLKTALQEADFCPEEQEENKQEELSKEKILLPILNTGKGLPKSADEERGGRPATKSAAGVKGTGSKAKSGR